MGLSFDCEFKGLNELYSVDVDVNDKGKYKFTDGDSKVVMTCSDGYRFESVTFTVVMFRYAEFTYSFEVGHGEFHEDGVVFHLDVVKSIVEDLNKDLDDCIMGNVEVTTVEYTGGGGSGEDYITKILDIYKLDDKQLIELTGLNFLTGSEYTDLIYNVYYLPLPMGDTGLSGEVEEIEFIDSKTGVVAPYYSNDRVLIDAGTIEVPYKYNNVFDFKNTTCKVYAPYVTPFDVDVYHVIGRELGLSYGIDLLNGRGFLYVVDVEGGDTLYTKEVEMSRAVPYMQVDFMDKYSSDVGVYKYTTIKTPYIEVRRPLPVGDTSCIHGKLSVGCGLVGDYEGYLRVRDVEVRSEATENEKTLIRNKLLEGVYIK